MTTKQDLLDAGLTEATLNHFNPSDYGNLAELCANTYAAAINCLVAYDPHTYGNFRYLSLQAETYCGCYETPGEYAEQLFHDCDDTIDKLNPFIACHIDWEGVERDMQLSGDIMVIRTGYAEIHIFTNV